MKVNFKGGHQFQFNYETYRNLYIFIAVVFNFLKLEGIFNFLKHNLYDKLLYDPIV